MISYSQNFEDVILARLFQGQTSGFYIDVGAWDPTRHSVTKHFYDLGWSGVNIEPVARQYQLFIEERPRDQNLNVAVADVPGQLRFYECKELTSLSTASDAQAQELRRAGYDVVSYDVQVVTLEYVISRCDDRAIDFLKVDVEGFEAAVLRGIDWSRRRPRVLVVEATLPSVKIEDWDQVDSIRNWDSWEPALLASNYELVWYDGLSRFYLRKEDAVLRKRLALPPCVHDGFELAEVHELKRTHQMLMKEREDVLNTNIRLESELRAVASDRADKDRVIGTLDGQVTELKSNLLMLMTERESALEANERLSRELRAVEADRAEKARILDGLAEEVIGLKNAQQQLTDERHNVLEANQRLEGQLRAVEQDRAEKSDLVAHLAREIAGVTSERDVLLGEREDIVGASGRLESELRAIVADQTEKAAVIGRLVEEVAELRRGKQALLDEKERILIAGQRFQAELAVARADGTKKSEVIDRLSADVERRSVESTIQSHKLVAKDQVLELAAVRNLKSKAVLGGFGDLLIRRQHKSPTYGDYHPAETAGSGLHVAIDTLEIVFGISGGVETYMKMLTSALVESGRRVTLICLPDQMAALRRLFGTKVGYFVMRKSRAVALAIEVPNRILGARLRLSAATSMATFSRLREDIGVDLLHSPVQIFSVLDFRVPSVLNLHDLQHLHFPENFTPSDIDARNRLYGLSASLADAIVVSSDFVRNDLVTQMQVPPAKVFTVPVTWDPRVVEGLGGFSVQDATSQYKLPPIYAVYPAQFWPHKNHARLVKALRIVRDKRPNIDLKLVFTGYRGHSGWPAVKATIEELGLEADVICLDHVPVYHLAAIYKGSIYCVMPSTFEASSYPVIEAQALGVPAMCSDVTSLPELVRGEAGLLFDPFDVEDIAAKMLQWLDDPEDRGAHAARARAKATHEHSVEQYVNGLANAYEHACGVRERPYKGHAEVAVPA
jgi:FkbM family methyltransferase